jgi:transposase
MYHIGIDISKYKHDCCITTAAGVLIKSFVFSNNNEGFKLFISELKQLDQSEQIKIGLESTGHYGNNLKELIISNGYTFVEFNPRLTRKFSEALTLRKTKTDKIDARLISIMLGSVDYETLHNKFYHTSGLKQLTRHRDVLISDKSKCLVRLTNYLDYTFPEFKAFFNGVFGVSAIFILRKYHNKETIAKLDKRHYEQLRCISRGKFTYARFNNLKLLANSSIGIRDSNIDYLISSLITQIDFLVLQLESIDKQIKSVYNNTDSVISSIPGLGLITAATIYAEIGDINNFENSNQLIAYAGLDVSVSQSGQVENRGKIVKRGSPLLRKALYNYAFLTLKFIPEFHDYYLKKRDDGKHHKVILIHICRKLLRIIFHL